MAGLLPALPGVLPALMVLAWAVNARPPCHRPRLPSAGGVAAERMSRREAVALALLVAGAWAAIGGELLSQGRLLSFWPLLLWWAIPSVALAASAVLSIRRRAEWPGTRAADQDERRPIRAQRDPVTLSIIAFTAAILLATALVALLTPPNTWDAMTYHMPRQVYWMEQRSIAHYPAEDLRQLEFPPMAESLGAQVLILFGGADRWSNMPQWAAFLGCILVGSLIARDLGAGARGQAIAALLVTAYPPALQQAVNVKNDVTVALWVLLLVWLGLRMWIDRSCAPSRVTFVGLAAGLCLYTKGTSYLFILPIAALLAVWMLLAFRARAVPLAVAMAAIAMSINIGHWTRNYATFGHPLGRSAAGEGYDLNNELVSPGVLASSIVRNLALHTAVPSERANEAQTRWIKALHSSLGIDASDPRTSTPRGVDWHVHWRLDEDNHAGGPFHLLLALAAPILLVAGRARTGASVGAPPAAGSLRWGVAWSVLAVAGAMFLLFCLVLKWQQWHARLHTPIVALLAPICGALLPMAGARLVTSALMLGAVALGLTSILYGGAKPLVGESSILSLTREQIRFRNYDTALDAARDAVSAAAAHNPEVVGITRGVRGAEYGVQRLVMDRVSPRPRLVAGRPRFGPALSSSFVLPDVTLVWHGTAIAFTRPPDQSRYVAVAQFPPITVYARETGGRPVPSDPSSMPFIGWRPVNGLGPPIGPFPERRLPVVRWGLGDCTRLEFWSDGAPADLIFESRPSRVTDQVVEVFLNTEPVYRFEFGAGARFSRHRVPLSPKVGQNLVEFRYAKTHRVASGQEHSLLFRKLQIIPQPQIGK